MIALSEGGEIFMKMGEQFFAHRFAQLRDKFGINWMILHEKPMRETSIWLRMYQRGAPGLGLRTWEPWNLWYEFMRLIIS